MKGIRLNQGVFIASKDRKTTKEIRIRSDNDKYLTMQSEHIGKRIEELGGKLYLEFGGKLFDGYHASRVLPGFGPDNKLRMPLQMADQAGIIIVINAADIEKNKVRHDLDIIYDEDILHLIQELRDKGLYIGSVATTQHSDQGGIDQFKVRLEYRDIKVYRHYCIEGYPSNVPLIVNDGGPGKDDYIETAGSLVVITAPSPKDGKIATCLSQLYHENKRGIKAGYAKFETFPTWNLPLEHPVSLAYEAVTAGLDDVNMIDPFHLEAYGRTTANYNRDVDILPAFDAIFKGIYGTSPYRSPTDMGINTAGFCIIDDETCREVSYQKIARRYCYALNRLAKEEGSSDEICKISLFTNQAKITTAMRRVIAPCMERVQQLGSPTVTMELEDGQLVAGKTNALLGTSVTLLPNAIKVLGSIHHDVHLIAPPTIEPAQILKIQHVGNKNPRLHTDEVSIALSMGAATDNTARKVLSQLPKPRGYQVYTSIMLSDVDIRVFKKLGVELTFEPIYEHKKLYHQQI